MHTAKFLIICGFIGIIAGLRIWHWVAVGQQREVRVGETFLITSHPYYSNTSQVIKYKGKLLYTSYYPEYLMGDCVRVDEINSFSGRLLNVTLVAQPVCANNYIQRVSRLRSELIQQYRKKYPAPESGIILGMTLGYKYDFSDQLDAKIKSVGIAHILVVSGSNFALLSSLIRKLTSNYGKPIYLFALLFGLSLYLMVSGLEVPGFRAYLMALVGGVCTAYGNKYVALYYLFCLACLFILLQPFIYSDLSFIFSFLSTLALLLASFIPLKSDVVPYLFIVVLLLPVNLIFLGEYNLLSVVMNLIILPFVPLVTLVAFMGVIFQNTLFIQWVNYIPISLVYCMIWIINLLFSTTGDSWVINYSPRRIEIVGYYTVIPLALMTYIFRLRRRRYNGYANN